MYGGRCQGFLKSVKGLLCLLIPQEWSILIQQVHKSLGQIGIINDKYTQEINCPLEILKVSNCAWGLKV